MSERVSSGDEAASGNGRLAVQTPVAGWIELTAPSRQEYLDRIASFVEKIDEELDALAGARLDHETREEVKLALTEIASNAMEWGNRGDESRRVHVSYGLFPGELVLKVEDEGEGFDPAAVPDPTVSPAALQRRRLAGGKRMGGFGLLVARKVMDRVIHSERGNCVLLTKSLPGRVDNGLQQGQTG